MERNKAVKLAQELRTRLVKGRRPQIVYKNPEGEIKIVGTQSLAAEMLMNYHYDWIIGLYDYRNPPSQEMLIEDILAA